METKKHSKMAWLWENMKGYRLIYLVGIIGTIVYNAMQLTVPYITQKIIDTFITHEHARENMENCQRQIKCRLSSILNRMDDCRDQ